MSRVKTVMDSSMSRWRMCTQTWPGVIGDGIGKGLQAPTHALGVKQSIKRSTVKVYIKWTVTHKR